MNWNTLRDQFPVTKIWAFFDHAAVAPHSLAAQQALIEWTNDLAKNGGLTERRWLERLKEVRQAAGRLLNADPDDIAFIKNTSEGIGIVAEGFPWKPGDNVVIAEEEYPANVYPWMNLNDRGVEVRRVPSRGPRIEIDDIRDVMNDRTRIVSLSWVEYASGFRNDLAAVGQLCRERDTYFFVDAIQGLGVLPMDARNLPIDFLAADGHKWLLAPEGAGLFYIRRELVEMLHAVDIGWNSVIGARDFSRIEFKLKPNAGRWESGSLNVGGISALGASIELLLEIGIEQVCERVLELTDRICEGANRIGRDVFSSRECRDRSGIVSLNADSGEAREIVRRCREAGIVINQRAGRLRVSSHFYNGEEEVERLISALARQ